MTGAGTSMSFNISVPPAPVNMTAFKWVTPQWQKKPKPIFPIP
jgi:hypothetical protein